jgi:hypothetical protein
MVAELYQLCFQSEIFDLTILVSPSGPFGSPWEPFYYFDLIVLLLTVCHTGVPWDDSSNVLI